MLRLPNRAWARSLPGIVRSPTARCWLQDQGSLTARLQQHGSFKLDLLSQKQMPVSRDEAGQFGMRAGQQVQARHVVLFSNELPVVFAHSVLPNDPTGVLSRWFARMGSRSLGARLFANPGFRRGPLEYRRIDCRHPLFAAAVIALGLPSETRTRLWARRRFFHFGRQRVLVTEIFSPTLLSARCSPADPVPVV